MQLPRLPFPPSRPTVWAVEPTIVQLAWGHLPSGPVTATARVDGRAVAETVHEHDGGPGVLDIDGLRPGVDHTVHVSAGGSTFGLDATTPQPPPGEALFRFATVSDLHLGSQHFGVFRQMRDRSGHPEPFAVRSARSAIDAARTWGAEHLIIKGDAAHHGRHSDFELVGQLVDQLDGLSVSLLPGNHDVDQRETPLPATVGNRGTRYVDGVDHVDRPGIRIVVADTTIARAGVGTLRHIGDDLVGTAADSDCGVAVVVHQQLQPGDPVRHWPPGIPGHESNRFLDRLATVAPDALITSGHTHRNRARRHGDITITEVASTHHWPGVWAGYAVHEGGVRQVVRRIGGDVIDWHEYSKNAVLSIWQRYAAGRLEHRCVTHGWRR